MSAQTYADLLIEAMPRPIRTEAEADRVQTLVDRLIDRASTLTEDEHDLLRLLGSLIESWEEGRYDLPATTPIQRLRAYLEDTGMTQASLVGPVFPTKSLASEVLSGKRPLTYAYVGRLIEHLRLPAAFFFDDPTSRQLAS